MKHLFASFLEHPSSYALNERYWRKLVADALPENAVQATDIYETHYANGQKMRDGNPIFSARLQDGNTIRIIQEEIESATPIVSAWTETTANGAEELVISLELSDVTRDLVIDLLKNYPDQKFSELPDLLQRKIAGGTPNYAMAA